MAKRSILIAIGVGVIAAFLSFSFLTYVAHVSIANAVLLSLSLVTFYTLITFFVIRRHHKRHQKEDYETQVKNLFILVRRQMRETLAFCGQIKNHEVTELLTLICEDMEVLLTKVAEKKPNSRKSAATNLGLHLAYLTEDILPQYIEMQNAPRFFINSSEKLKRAQIALRNLEEYLRGSITLLEEGDDSRFEIALKLVDPLQRSVLF